MKKFKFFICDYKGEIICASNGFDVSRKLPPEFTVKDILNEPALGKNVKKRAPGMREGTMIQVCQLCGWSSSSGGAEYLFIKCIGDSSKIDQLRDQFDKVSLEIDELNKKIAKLAGPLMDELKQLDKVKKSLKEQIKNFDKSGEL